MVKKNNSTRQPSSHSPELTHDRHSWLSYELRVALAGLLLWAALPPLNWWPLAWLFPIPLATLIETRDWNIRRPYLRLWVIGMLFWIAVLQGVRLAHWGNYFGLLGLGLYYGCFWPLFMATARSLRHRFSFPLPAAMAISWVGMEWLRGRGPVGLSGASLSHTQVHQTWLIQIADLAGAYGLSFLMMATAGSVAAWRFTESSKRSSIKYAWLGGSIGLVCLCIAYGGWRVNEKFESPDTRSIRVALIQGNIDSEFNIDPSRPERMIREYGQLTYDAHKNFGDLDLVVWPESMFPVEFIVLDSDAEVLAGEHQRDDLIATQDVFNSLVRNLARGINQVPSTSQGPARKTWLVLGVSILEMDDQTTRRYNSALLIDPTGKIVGRYDKMHPIIFGEFMPLGEWFPWLYRLTPVGNGLTAGTHPSSFEVDGIRMSPSICFESTVPHLIRRQVAELAQADTPADVLLNITNDGWFWGSSILDIQLHCAVFRAVENRKPMVIAANTGFSAWIDQMGQLRAQGPRHDTGYLLAECWPNSRRTLYFWLGDWLWIGCLAISLVSLAFRRTGMPLKSTHQRQTSDDSQAENHGKKASDSS